MLSVIVPALNEEFAIQQTIDSICKGLEANSIEYEIIVINDGSTDNTGNIAESLCEKININVIHHPKPGGYGYSLKQGIKKARYDLIAITDADGTYPNDILPELYNLVVQNGYDMAIGARTGPEYRGSFFKMPARWVFLWLCEYTTGQKIDDINSGLRVFKKEVALKYIHTISNGFSFTTTITLAAMLNGYFVKYIPIKYYKRIGTSHVKYWRDTLRCLQIIVENILYYNPLKIFLLIVNTMCCISIFSFLLFLFTKNIKLSYFFGGLSALFFDSIFIVAAIGLLSDLYRISSKTETK